MRQSGTEKMRDERKWRRRSVRGRREGTEESGTAG